MSEGNITPKQKEILEYIKDQILTRGFPPAVRELSLIHISEPTRPY